MAYVEGIFDWAIFPKGAMISEKQVILDSLLTQITKGAILIKTIARDAKPLPGMIQEQYKSYKQALDKYSNEITEIAKWLLSNSTQIRLLEFYNIPLIISALAEKKIGVFVSQLYLGTEKIFPNLSTFSNVPDAIKNIFRERIDAVEAGKLTTIAWEATKESGKEVGKEFEKIGKTIFTVLKIPGAAAEGAVTITKALPFIIFGIIGLVGYAAYKTVKEPEKYVSAAERAIKLKTKF